MANQLNVGDIVQLKVYRKGDYITLNVELSELEQSQEED
jgi:S1-C subfamily serine protease